MKRIVLASVCASAAAAAGYGLYPLEAEHSVRAAAAALLRLWQNIEVNPVPVLIALGTFLVTVGYHTARGKSLRESVAVAATRVTVVPVPERQPKEVENAVVRRAKARATRAQLIADQIGVENRHRKLPEEIVKAEKEACYTQHDLADAERGLAGRQKAHQEAVAKLEALRKEKAARDAELAEIAAELKKLAELV